MIVIWIFVKGKTSGVGNNRNYNQNTKDLAFGNFNKSP